MNIWFSKNLNVSSCTNDKETVLLLQNICSAVLDVCYRQLVDQLPGVKFSKTGPDIQKMEASCNANNISGKSFHKIRFRDHYSS